MNHFFRNNNLFMLSIVAIPAVLFRWQIDQIFIVNTIGCFLLGFINSLPISKRYKLIFGFGFCGSLTTFSGWSFLLFKLINQGFYKLFFVNTILIVILCIFAVGLGDLLAKKLIN